MSHKGSVPDAWDDDWETVADKEEASISQPEPAPKLSKAQRRAQHQEQQKQLWDSADNPDRFHWLEAQGVVPLKQEYKPQVTLLSRKPGALSIAKKDGLANGVANLNVDDDEDSEEEAREKRESELEERIQKAKLEREEKQRRYAEARERIMGSSSPVPVSSSSTPATATAAARSRESSHGRENRRSRGKINGKGNNSQPTSSADQSPSRPASGGTALFDPDDMGRRLPKREVRDVINGPREDQPLRQPRGPESGRGGFGFGGRGGRAGP